MENIDKAIEINLESWKKVGIPVPKAYENWCIQHGRLDLLDCNKPNLSTESQFLPLPNMAEMFGIEPSADMAHESSIEPATEEDINSMLNLALEAMARDLGIKIPANLTSETSNDKNGDLPSMEEIFGMKRKE